MREGLEIVAIHNAAEFEAAAKIGPYQLVTGAGAIDLLSELTDAELESCFLNCVLASSVGPNGNSTEDKLDDISIRLQRDSEQGFFPTISGPTYQEVVWIMIPQSLETPRLLAMSTRDDFRQEVHAWFERADAELAEEAAE